MSLNASRLSYFQLVFFKIKATIHQTLILNYNLEYFTFK